MRVEIIDDTHQRFNGKMYRRNKRGWFQNTYSTIHRAVWTFHNGEIPKGYDIHHIDGDKANNQIENLQCLTRKEHRRLHALPVAERQFVCVDCGRQFTHKAYHVSRCPECRKKHERELARAKRQPQPPMPPKPPRTRQCVVCGKTFELKPRDSAGAHGRKTCSDECKQILRQQCSQAQRVDKRRICEVCGKSFEYKHKHNRTCSPECGKKLAGRTRTGRRVVERVVSHCELCGKPIEHQPCKHPRFCSQDCVHKYMAQVNTKTEHVSPKEIRTCIVCGKSFEYKHKHNRACSPECRRRLKMKSC